MTKPLGEGPFVSNNSPERNRFESADTLTAPPQAKPRSWRPRVGPVEQPTPEEPSWQQWRKDPTPGRLRGLVDSLDPVIKAATKHYGKTDSPVVLDRARILAARAIRSYDPSRGADLKTHVTRQLQTLQRLTPQITDPLPPPERLRRDRAIVAKAIEEARNDIGRDVTDEEVAERIKVPVARVTKVRRLMNARIPMSVMEEQDSNDDRPDVVGSNRSEYDDWTDAVYQELGSVDRLILSHRTGYRGAEILGGAELAQRLNLSPAAVSQRASRIQARLDEFHTPTGPR